MTVGPSMYAPRRTRAPASTRTSPTKVAPPSTSAWFAPEVGPLSVIPLDHADRPGIRALRQRNARSPALPVVGNHRGERLPRNHHIAVHAQERAVHVRSHASDRMGRPEPLRLLLVRDREAEGIAVSEARADPVALPADQDGHLRDARRAERLQRVPEKRLSGHREKGLRKIGREGTHPGALSRREDHGLHSVAPFALDRTVEYISFALAASRDSAVSRIFGSVPEKRTRHQPSSNWSRHPSTVLTSPPSARKTSSRRDPIRSRFDGSYGIDPRSTG